MIALVNHPGMRLREDAAASLARFERDHGVQPLTSAYRPVSEQQELIDRWDEGGPLNRPPFLYAPRRPASEGLHTKGTALDTSAPQAFHVDGERYGWLFLYDYDKVHFEYNPSRDTKPAPVSIPAIKEALEMARPTFIDAPSGQFISVGGVVANMNSPKNVKDFGEKNKSKYDTIWLPDDVVRQLR